MAFLVYDRVYGGVVSRHDTKDIADTFADDADHAVYEYAFDPSTEALRALKLNAAGNGLENKWPTKTLVEQQGLALKEQEDKDLAKRKAEKKQRISDYVGEILEDWDWKTERAMERDFLNGNDDAMKALAAQRKKLRDDGDVHKAGVDALADAAAVKAYSHVFTTKAAYGIGRNIYGNRG